MMESMETAHSTGDWGRRGKGEAAAAAAALRSHIFFWAVEAAARGRSTALGRAFYTCASTMGGS